MRMWNVDPALLCRAHLLGEHRELHALVGSILKGISIEGYIKSPTSGECLVEVHNIISRHEALHAEMHKRWETPYSPLKEFVPWETPGVINAELNRVRLRLNCPHCRERYATGNSFTT